jgi:hypothetical protein
MPHRVDLKRLNIKMKDVFKCTEVNVNENEKSGMPEDI